MVREIRRDKKLRGGRENKKEMKGKVRRGEEGKGSEMLVVDAEEKGKE